MKKFLILLGLITLSTGAASAQTRVSGYTRSNGTYVAPHTKSTTNSTNIDNYSTKGSSNPYTATSGTRVQDYSPASNYGGGRQVQTGSRGGQYYVNDSGKKVYVPKQ